ncbi:DNA gyrase C-terminal beta-propeller domain-containing protein, partial [Klebsiella pneumoniae]|uniref:DNA gyrase C-terminal beta-propeller domain-containing protein n=1 Tax=Klebsiella pneumoniae TaxID=573 RepID=UPI00272F53E2
TDQAKLIRMPLASLRVIGRSSAGVRQFNVGDGEHVVGCARIDEEPEPENAAEEAVAAELSGPEIAPDDGGTIGDDAAAGPEDGQ